MCICMSVHGVLSNTVSQNSPGYEVDIASTGVFYVAQPAEYFSLWEKHMVVGSKPTRTLSVVLAII